MWVEVSSNENAGVLTVVELAQPLFTLSAALIVNAVKGKTPLVQERNEEMKTKKDK